MHCRSPYWLGNDRFSKRLGCGEEAVGICPRFIALLGGAGAAMRRENGGSQESRLVFDLCFFCWLCCFFCSRRRRVAERGVVVFRRGGFGVRASVRRSWRRAMAARRLACWER